MAKRPYAFEGKRFKPSRLKALLNLSLSRTSILMNKRQPRCSLARSDVLHLLGLGLHQHALSRVERVIEEQNMLDALAMIQSYCSVVIERVNIIKEHKECPDELEEAISSLIYASKRIGEFPEVRVMRGVFATLFGSEFVEGAVELHKGCGVDIKMIEKLCNKKPSLETRKKVLQEIATENCIDLTCMNVVEPFSTSTRGDDDAVQEDLQPTAEAEDGECDLHQMDVEQVVLLDGVLSQTKDASEDEKIYSINRLHPWDEDSTSSEDSDSYSSGSSLMTKTPLQDYRQRAVSVRTRR